MRKKKSWKLAKNITGISTGYKVIDRLFNGLQPGEVTLIGGKPLVGKSTLALNIAINVMKRTNKKVVFFGSSLGYGYVEKWILAYLSDIPIWDVFRWDYSKEQWERFIHATEEYRKFNFDVFGAYRLEYISKECDELSKEGEIGLIVIDYLQIIETYNKKTIENPNEVMIELSALAKRLNIPIIVLTSLREKAMTRRKDKRPCARDLKNAGISEEYWENALLLHREDKYNYESIEKIEIVPNKKKLLIRTDDGNKIIIKTNRRISRKILEFITDIIEYNGEISNIDYEVDYLRVPDDSLSNNVGIEVAKREMINIGFAEEKFHGAQGHGFAAERANNMIDRLHGKNAKVIGDNNAPNGADREKKHWGGNSEFIQTKYCKSAADSINACFKDGEFRYYSDLSKTKPMSIEVPKDQYEEAVKAFSKKIADGKVKGVTNPEDASKIIKKGNITYNQAVKIAKAGNIESLKYDAANGAVVSLSAFGLSAIVALATSVWNGEEIDVALKNATTTGLRVGGASFVTSVMASQLSKAGLNSALRSSTEALTKQLGSKTSAAIANAFRGSAAKQIYGAAAMKSAAKILRTNIITSIVMIVVFSFGDFINLIRRRISFGQFIKNFIILALSIVAGIFGGILGGMLGTLILPGFGTTVISLIVAIAAGTLTSFLGKKLLSLFLEEDADKMIKIIDEQFKGLADEYMLNRIEQEKVIDKLTMKLDVKALRKMVASKDKNQYAREKLLSPIIENQVKKRKVIAEPPIEVMMKSLDSVVLNGVED